MARPLTRPLVVLCVLAFGTAAGPAFKKGQNLAAAGELKAALLEDPDNCRLHTRLGVLHARRGMWADALGSLELCAGGEEYEEKGISYHAHALRMFGRGAEAAELRQTRLLVPKDDELEIRVLLETADDLRAAGDHTGALDACWRAVAIQPRGSAIHASLAEIHWELGEMDEAEYHLWVAMRDDKPRLGAVRLLARQQMADGDLDAADATLERARRMQPLDLDAALLRAELRTLQGVPDQAASMLTRDSWRNNETPRLMRGQIRALRAAGRDAEADTVQERYDALYG